MSWLDKVFPPKIKRSENANRRVPEGVWVKCPSCETALYHDDLVKNLNVCPKCDHHLRISARERINMLLDTEDREEIGASVRSTDPLKFKDSRKYTDRITEAVKSTDETDALVVVRGTMASVPVVVAALSLILWVVQWGLSLVSVLFEACRQQLNIVLLLFVLLLLVVLVCRRVCSLLCKWPKPMRC